MIKYLTRHKQASNATVCRSSIAGGAGTHRDVASTPQHPSHLPSTFVCRLCVFLLCQLNWTNHRHWRSHYYRPYRRRVVFDQSVYDKPVRFHFVTPGYFPTDPVLLGSALCTLPALSKKHNLQDRSVVGHINIAFDTYLDTSIRCTTTARTRFAQSLNRHQPALSPALTQQLNSRTWRPQLQS